LRKSWNRLPKIGHPVSQMRPDEVYGAFVRRLAFPKRLACFFLRPFSSNTDVFEFAIIHLHQVSSLPVAFTAQPASCSEATEDPQKRTYCWCSIDPMEIRISCSRGLGSLVQSLIDCQRTLSKQIGLFLYFHPISFSFLDLKNGSQRLLALSLTVRCELRYFRYFGPPPNGRAFPGSGKPGQLPPLCYPDT
jgi:hypothetical protein